MFLERRLKGIPTILGMYGIITPSTSVRNVWNKKNIKKNVQLLIVVAYDWNYCKKKAHTTNTFPGVLAPASPLRLHDIDYIYSFHDSHDS